MTNLIDSIFDPVLKLLDNMQDRLLGITNVAARGLDLDNYLGFLRILGPSWSGVIFSLLTAFSFLLILYAIKTNSRLYLWFKDLVKWW